MSDPAPEILFHSSAQGPLGTDHPATRPLPCPCAPLSSRTLPSPRPYPSSLNDRSCRIRRHIHQDETNESLSQLTLRTSKGNLALLSKRVGVFNIVESRRLCHPGTRLAFHQSPIFPFFFLHASKKHPQPRNHPAHLHTLPAPTAHTEATSDRESNTV